jgi:hypothetical protein
VCACAWCAVVLLNQWSGTLESFTTSLDRYDNDTRDALFAALHRLPRLRRLIFTGTLESKLMPQLYFIDISRCRQLKLLQMSSYRGIKDSLDLLDPLRAIGCDIRIHHPPGYSYGYDDNVVDFD